MRAVHRHLVGELACIACRRIEPPDIVALELGIGQVVDQRPGLRDPPAVRSAGDIGRHPALVRDDDHPVAGHADVELERADAEGERLGEGRQGVLRSQAARAAMTLEIEGVCRERDAADERGKEQPDHSGSRYFANR